MAAPRILLWAGALIAGAAQALSIAAPWDGQPHWWLQLLSLAGLYGLLRRETRPRGGFALAWLFAIAWLAATFWWLYISMHVYGGLPAVLAALAVLALAAFLGLYYAAAGALFVRWRSGRRARDALLFAGLWLAAELMRASWFTGFPWGAGGYAHIDGPLDALAPWIGVYGIGFLAGLAAALLASLTARPAWRSWRGAEGALVLVAACGALLGATALPAQTTPGGLSVALLQGNIPQDEKFQPGTGVPTALRWYAEQLRDAKAQLVVAPETAIPMLPDQLPEGYWEALRGRFAQGGQAALVGIPLGSFSEGYTNSVVGLKSGQPAPYRYDKFHLVPFGEFIPPLFKWFTKMMDIPLGDFNRGAVKQPSFEWQGQRLAPNVCYEDLFGEDLAARFADAATAPTMFVNVSNIGWFGDSVAIDQHLQISRMRALEFARPMIRATNTGATVIIDAQGRVTHSLPRLTRAVLTGEVRGNERITPYAAWLARLGLWPLWALALLLVLASRRRS